MLNTDIILTHPPNPASPSSLPLCTLTMYDLPSEDPEEPGLPDEFHGLQPQLLSRTLQVFGALAGQLFTATDLNLYYDPAQPLWHKRPDWFLVVGVPRLYENRDLRNSYVIWDEKVSPLLVVEFISPGTEAEDLGRFYEPKGKSKSPLASPDLAPGSPEEVPPAKFKVYEEILSILNYVVYDRRTLNLRYFRLIAGRYQEQPLAANNPRLWIPELELGLGIWQGIFGGVEHAWLRWCDAQGNWCLTDTEEEREAKEAALWREMQERAAKEAAEAELAEERRLRGILTERLRAMGVDPETLL